MRHLPFIVFLAVFAGLAATYNFVLPVGEVSDAPAHFALVRFIAEEGRPPLSLEERTAVGIKGDASPLYHGLVALLTQQVDISPLPELPRLHQKAERTIPGDGRLLQFFFHTEDEAFPFQGMVLAWHLAGLVSVPLGMATLIAIYLTVLSLYPDQTSLALTAAVFAGLIPRFLISSAVVNDDNLVFPLIAISLYFLVKIIQGDQRIRIFLALGGVMGLAAVTKYHALVLAPEMTLVVLLLAWRDPWSWRQTLRRWGLSSLAYAVAAGWWFGFVFFRFSDVEDSGVVGGVLAPLGDPVLTEGLPQLLSADFNAISLREFGPWLSWTFRTFWLDYDGLHAGMELLSRETLYWALYGGLALLSMLLIVGLALALGRATRNAGRRLKRLDLVLLALHLGLYLGLVLGRYLLHPDPSTAQGRHLFPALPALALFAALGWAELRRACSKLAWRWPGQSGLPLGLGAILVAANLIILGAFIGPVYYPFLPVNTMHPDKAAMAARLPHQFAEELRFEGFNLLTRDLQAGELLPVTLFWRTRIKQTHDYLIRLCLYDQAGAVAACWQGYPVDGRYPTRAWESGYLIRDEIYLPTPACLAGGDYALKLALLPLRADTVEPTVDQALPAGDPLLLASITVRPGESPAGFKLWTGQRRLQPGQATVWQLRQALTLIDYRTAQEPPVFASLARSAATWRPLADPIRYSCSSTMTALTYSFIVHPGLQPGSYLLRSGDSTAAWQLRLTTRPRSFEPPPGLPGETERLLGEEIKLVGYEVDLSPRLPGEPVEVTIIWQALKTMSRAYVGSVHVLDNDMTTWSQIDHPLGSGYYPNVLWAPGEVIEDRYQLPLHSFIAAGRYRLKLSVYDYTDGQFDFLTFDPNDNASPTDLFLGHIRVLDEAAARPPSRPRQVTLGEQIQLLGFDLDSGPFSTAATFDLALHWQAVAPPAADYTVFTQLIGPDDQVWAQQDNQPQGGSYPTMAWPPNERVVDRYRLNLNPGAPRGEYRLLVGMYDLNTGQRLPAVDEAGQSLPDSAILLTTLFLE